MLSAGSQRAGKACLRSQLRNVIASLGHKRATQPFLPISTSCRLNEEDTISAERRPSDFRHNTGYVYRHINPHGRIIGKPGRRQRQSSEQLATASLGRPSEVIVLRDVEQELGEPEHLPAESVQTHEEDTGEESERLALDSSEIHDLVAGEQHPPEQEEVNASIESLRPESLVLEQRQYLRLKKRLVDSYNVTQLACYLVQSVTTAPPSTDASQADDHAIRTIRKTPWRPGQTPLEQRLGRVSFNKGQLSHNKAGLAEQILRLSWNVFIQSEEQRLGELELYVRRWQSTLLFDVSHEGKQNIESFINSPLLARASDIRPYKRDNIIRITARQRDAEEIVRLLEEKFRSADRQELDLKVFKPLLGKEGWPGSFEKLFREEDLKYVSDRTNTVLEMEPDGKLGIYCIHEHGKAAQARRLLISLLDIPSARESHDSLQLQASHRRGRSPLMPYRRRTADLKLAQYPVLDCHRRYQDQELFRLVSSAVIPELHSKQPEVRQGVGRALSSSGLPEMPGGAAERFLTTLLAGRLDELVQRSPGSHMDAQEQGPWSTEQHNPSWTARMGVLLQTPAKADTKNAWPHKGVFLDQMTDLHNLLSLFEPAESDEQLRFQATTQLIAHLRPSPFSVLDISALKHLPDIAMCFDHSIAYSVRGPDHQLRMRSVSAALKEQELKIALPYHAVDLSFLSSMMMSLSKEGWRNPELRDFVNQLQASVRRGTGALEGKPEVKIKLPSSVASHALPKVESSGEENGDVAIDYLLDYFEQVQVRDYIPLRDEKRVSRMSPEARAMVDQWPESMVLRCREIDAGSFGGRRTEVSLVQSREQTGKQSAAETVTAQQDGSARLAEAHHEPPNDATQTMPVDKVARKDSSPTHQLVRVALSLAQLVTSANAGKLESPYAGTLPRVQRYSSTRSRSTGVE